MLRGLQHHHEDNEGHGNRDAHDAPEWAVPHPSDGDGSDRPGAREDERDNEDDEVHQEANGVAHPGDEVEDGGERAHAELEAEEHQEEPQVAVEFGLLIVEFFQLVDDIADRLLALRQFSTVRQLLPAVRPGTEVETV